MPTSGVTSYGLDSPEFEPWWGQDFLYISGPGRRPTQPHVQWVAGLLPRGNVARAWH